MNEADALDIIQHAVWTVMAAAGPAVGAAMVVGLIVALFQALTQIQEMTLTFVPKIVVVLLVTALTRVVHRRAALHLHGGSVCAHRQGLLNSLFPDAHDQLTGNRVKLPGVNMVALENCMVRPALPQGRGGQTVRVLADGRIRQLKLANLGVRLQNRRPLR